ncbi:hypothetical protein B0H13DRAFT_1851027 [Mycena leptocephala]|nr:hypothetical protein B0H13DRAFT_1851027 [Mycena leptocephala]
MLAKFSLINRKRGEIQIGMVTGTGQPGGFPGRVSAGTGTGYNFSGPETRGYTTGLQIFDFLVEFKSFQGATSHKLYSQASVKLLMHSKVPIIGHISCFEGVEGARQASAVLIRSIRTTRGQPVDPWFSDWREHSTVRDETWAWIGEVERSKVQDPQDYAGESCTCQQRDGKRLTRTTTAVAHAAGGAHTGKPNASSWMSQKISKADARISTKKNGTWVIACDLGWDEEEDIICPVGSASRGSRRDPETLNGIGSLVDDAI